MPFGQIVFSPSTKRKLCAFCKANQCLAEYNFCVGIVVVIFFEFLHSEICKNCTNFREFFSDYAHEFYIILRKKNITSALSGIFFSSSLISAHQDPAAATNVINVTQRNLKSLKRFDRVAENLQNTKHRDLFLCS